MKFKKLINGAALIVGLVLIGYSLWSRQGVRPLSETDCPHLPYGMPTGTPPTNDFICRDIYALSSNDDRKFADYVAYRLDKATITGSSEQSRDWKADPALAPEETLEPEDYQGAYKALGTDRGHLAPLASFRGKEWQTVNYLSNIAPLSASLNRSTWKNLEDHVRDLVRKHGEVYVMTGTVYEREMPKLPGADEPHQVPSGFWKIVIVDGKTEAYFFDQETYSGTDYKSGKTTVAEIERKTGIDLLPD